MLVHYYPDPVLREGTVPVEVFDQELAELAREMIEAMHASQGLGLAGPQVGSSRRIVIVSPDGQPGREIALVNPELIRTEGWEEAEEGCLSFPGIYVKIGRFTHVSVRYRNLKGQSEELSAEGLLARVIQHELDHLVGRLLVDRMSPVQRMAQRRNLRELERRHERRLARVKADAADVG
jgi:peptide deformylase